MKISSIVFCIVVFSIECWAQSTVSIYKTTAANECSQGTGFFINSTDIVTAYHVIANAHKLEITSGSALKVENPEFTIHKISGKFDLAII